MFLWWKKKTTPSRDLLYEALCDLSDQNSAQRALALFDSVLERERFYEEILSEPPWMESGRQPTDAELAFEIFRELLLLHGSLAVFDWAAHSEEIIETFNAMLAAVSLETLSEEETAEIMRATSNAKRGESFVHAQAILERAAVNRSFVCTSLSTDSDAYFLVLAPTAIAAKWRGQRFGKEYPILA